MKRWIKKKASRKIRFKRRIKRYTLVSSRSSSSFKFVANAACLGANFSVPPTELTGAFRMFTVVGEIRVIFWRVVVTRPFLTLVGTHTNAFMVDVTRIFAPSGTATMTVTIVHFVDNFRVSKRQELLFPNRELIVRIFCEHRDIPIGRERISFVVHNRAVVVFDAQIISFHFLLKIVLVVLFDISPLDFDPVVPVLTALFVVKADRVAEFVKSRGVVGATTICEADLLISTVLVTDG